MNCVLTWEDKNMVQYGIWQEMEAFVYNNWQEENYNHDQNNLEVVELKFSEEEQEIGLVFYETKDGIYMRSFSMI